MTRHRLVPIAVVVALFTVPAFAQPLPDIFNRVKSEFSQGDYKASLADVEVLDTASQKPGLESDHAKLAPVISFYRAANLAALGRADEAREEFVTFLAYSPNASIASPPFPKAVVDALEKARKAAAGRSNALGIAYAAFAPAAGWKFAADTQWAASPVRYLLSNDDKKQYAALTSDADRAAFVEKFWTTLDPTPGTEPNEFRREFERRVAFADATFGTEKKPGRETDRALVFTFLGPPTYASASDVRGQSDAIAMLRSGAGRTTGFEASAAGANDDSLEGPNQRGTREAWTYRRGRVPAGVPFPEVRFEFITKEGYGNGVLQKESDVLQTIGQATENARRNKKLN
ncbi:MAG TPA: GWxTD domain-containing protein [Thermoanaerobaculia bacterium]|nr:GWxTD domain-containing protein [Thermoanaerobaculia bacterium]